MINWPKQREWGWYATLIRTPKFCIKLLRFKPGGALSYQRHKHRTEIWFFLNGCGRVEHEDHFMKTTWDSDFIRKWKIKPGDWHRFMCYTIPTYVLEIQYGSKVTEEDIERQ